MLRCDERTIRRARPRAFGGHTVLLLRLNLLGISANGDSVTETLATAVPLITAVPFMLVARIDPNDQTPDGLAPAEMLLVV